MDAYRPPFLSMNWSAAEIINKITIDEMSHVLNDKPLWIGDGSFMSIISAPKWLIG